MEFLCVKHENKELKFWNNSVGDVGFKDSKKLKK